jgi:hypothetical protein
MSPHRIGSSAGTERLIKPVNSSIGTKWGVAGSSWESGHHTGLDFHASVGTAVHAAASGKVVEVNHMGGSYGNEVIIRHNGSFFTQYAHLSAFAAGLHVGQAVKQGQLIGKSGNTGNTTGPHLHFEVRKTQHYGSDVNPESYFGKPLKVEGGGDTGGSAGVSPATTPSTGGAVQNGSFAGPHKHKGHNAKGSAGSQALGGAATVGTNPTSTSPEYVPDPVVLPSIQIVMGDEGPALGGPVAAPTLQVIPLSGQEMTMLPSAVQIQLGKFNSLTADQQAQYLMQLLDMFDRNRDAAANSTDPAVRDKYARQASTTSAFLRSAAPAAIAQIDQAGTPIDTRLLAPAASAV